jgi:short subunit dehydrogenase-like uncharacterized protein
MAREYDLLLVGVTGFTGKLAAEYLFSKAYPIRWAVCARNEAKAREALQGAACAAGKPDAAAAAVVVEVADLTGEEEVLRAVVAKTRCVLTTAGPFERYGQALVRLCADLGVHYADITGESDFFRRMIEENDARARESGACIVVHCGNDCIPWDLTVYEMSKLASSVGAQLTSASTFTEVPASADALSGGTVTTAMFQLGKKRTKSKVTFDPLQTDANGAASACVTKNFSPKKDRHVAEFGRSGGPWIMGPVMANCVRRSNALLEYAPSLVYSDLMLRSPSLTGWLADTAYSALVGAAIFAPTLFGRFLPKPGEGPTREAMDKGFLIVHGRGKMTPTGGGPELAVRTKFTFNEDAGYLDTAKMLIESGMVLISDGERPAGVLTPAAALGSEIVRRIVREMPATFEIVQEAPVEFAPSKL